MAKKIKVAYVTNAVAESGVGYRAESIAGELAKSPQVTLDRWQIDGTAGRMERTGQPHSAVKPWPGFLGSKTVNWIRLGHQLTRALRQERPGILHLTNQSMSFLATRRIPTVITVHDLIEYTDPQTDTGGWFAKYSYSGIKRAQHIICVSEYTAQAVKKTFGIADANITVIPNAAGPEFYPMDDFAHTIAFQTWHQVLKIMPETKIVLYVGSEHPRKNLATALQAFARLRERHPHAIFVKVGAAGLPQYRASLLALVDKLGVRPDFRLLQVVTSEELNELYNLADVLIFPSILEGFGLPPLQAMAAGTPVITSNATSLPEVVGDAGIMHEPLDTTGFAASLERVLSDEALRQDLRANGFKQAAKFSWVKAAHAEAKVYEKVLTESHFRSGTGR